MRKPVTPWQKRLEQKIGEFKKRQLIASGRQGIFDKDGYLEKVLPLLLKKPLKTPPVDTGTGTPFFPGKQVKLFRFCLGSPTHAETKEFVRAEGITTHSWKIFIKFARQGTHRGHIWDWQETQGRYSIRYTRSRETYLAATGQ